MRISGIKKVIIQKGTVRESSYRGISMIILSVREKKIMKIRLL